LYWSETTKETMFDDIARIKNAKTRRESSWEKNGRNADYWPIPPQSTVVIADIKGPGKITHIWLTQSQHYREMLIKMTWDDAQTPSVIVPLGDFFCLGHSIVNSFQSLFFTASTNANNKFNSGCALNCYIPMPFKKRAVIELVNESKQSHGQYFHVDYELYEDEKPLEGMGYFHAEFHRENPFGGWAHEIPVNVPEANIVNKERLAWDNNYVILETKGKGHYIGCSYSVTNFQGTWWGEGDEMIWIDGYKWPPEIHGTGSEDYLNQAWGMQPNAFLRNGSSIYEQHTKGYQSSYIFHVENPMRFEKEIKVTIEFGHGNHLRNEVSSVAYWYAEAVTAIKTPPSVEKRMPVLRDAKGWIMDPKNQITTREIVPNQEMQLMKKRIKAKDFPEHVVVNGVLLIDDQANVCIKQQIARYNPELYDIPLIEFFDPFIGKTTHIELMEGIETDKKTIHWKLTGKLMKDAQDRISIESEGKPSKFADILKEWKDKIVEIEVLKVLDEDQDPKQPAGFEIIFIKRNQTDKPMPFF